MKKIRYYIFAAKWFWRNRTWEHTRQKYKAFDKAWKNHCKELGIA